MPLQPQIDGDLEAQSVRLACFEPPEGRSQWTLRLLANELIELLDSLSHENVQQVLKKGEEVRRPLPSEQQQPAHFDYEYKRIGVFSVFFFFRAAVRLALGHGVFSTYED